MHYLKEIETAVLQGFHTGNLAAKTILVSLLMALAFGLVIYFVYRFSCRSSFYDRDFNKSLAILPAITASIMLAMQSNILISLGMVGALSVVRFRNAVKNSIDLTYLFWSISLGIIVGIGLFKLAVLSSAFIMVLLFGLDLLPAARSPYIFVLTGEKDLQEDVLLETVKKYSSAVSVRSRNVSAASTEWILELKSKTPAKLLQEVNSLEGIVSANLLSHDGDVRY